MTQQIVSRRDVARLSDVLRTHPKWGYKFIVLHGNSVVPFSDKHCAHQYALATHGSLYDIKDVRDYGTNFVALKDDARAIEVD